MQIAYDAADNRIQVTDPRGNVTRYGYDPANRLITVTDALSKTTQLGYDANGNLLTQTNPLGHTSSFGYDALNRLLSATDALGHQGSRSYDALGRLTKSTDANDRATQYAYDADALGRLTVVTDAAGGKAVYAYDAVGNRTGITDPNGNTQQFVYDALNRLVQKSDPLGHFTRYGYDAVSNRIRRTDAKGQLLLYDYDADNRLTQISYPDRSRVQFSYDASGNRTQMMETKNFLVRRNSAYGFDALNRLTAHTDPFGKTVRSEYDKAGNRTGLIYPDGKRVRYDYDALNRMAKVTDWLGKATTYSYDDASNLKTVLNPNNTAANYAYDPAERLVQLANVKLPGNTVLASYTLNLDAVGNRSGIDRVEPLTPILKPDIDTYAYDADNRLLNIDRHAVQHDDNGNLTYKQGSAYRYDFEDRLESVTGLPFVFNRYDYDGVGNRLAANRGGWETRYTLDIAGPLSNVLMESNMLGIPQAYYVHGLGLISQIKPNGDARYYHFDTIGSTVALTDKSSKVTNAYTYDPFGQAVNQWRGPNAANNPFQYVGQFGVMEEGNGLQFMRARYYEAGLGRFGSKEPLVGNGIDTQKSNAFIYAVNNPLLFLDSNGLSAKESGGKKSYTIELAKTALGEVLGRAAELGAITLWSDAFRSNFLNILGTNKFGANIALAAPQLVKTISKIGDFSTLLDLAYYSGYEMYYRGVSGSTWSLENVMQNYAYALNNPAAFSRALQEGLSSVVAVTVNTVSGNSMGLTGEQLDKKVKPLGDWMGDKLYTWCNLCFNPR